ncbi:MAG: tRNA pseudouridine(38-40) synthase TruA [Thermodesulfobacteriota bacterium]|nr:tRNA pseudouridine(38-40) synthase TruA [Thermodesulfobacteriota bacterium]
MTRNLKLTIEYDGTHYHGWQRQKNDPTIQQAIEDALFKMTREKVTLTGSGRTDAGVHARGQVANFKTASRLTSENFQKGLNSLLNNDVVIIDCQEVPSDFHSRYDATAKTYQYCILNRPVPTAIDRHVSWHIRHPLDLDAMRAALPHIIGRHDFKSFEGGGGEKTNTVRHVMDAALVEAQDGFLFFQIKADGFLRYMVRNIAGTLVDVGTGKIPAKRLPAIINGKDRALGSPTAPPQGLCLISVEY